MTEENYDLDLKVWDAEATWRDTEFKATIHVIKGNDGDCGCHLHHQCDGKVVLQWHDYGPNGWAEFFYGPHALKAAKLRLSDLIRVVQFRTTLQNKQAWLDENILMLETVDG